MYSDLSVTVSAPVVREMEKAFSVLEMVSIVDGTAGEFSPDHKKVLDSAKATLEQLFLWGEDLLGDQAEFQMLLCRTLGWHKDVLETIRYIATEVDDFLADIHQTMVDVCAGRSVDEDDYDELTEFCLTVSEAIWEHFIRIHLEMAEN